MRKFPVALRKPEQQPTADNKSYDAGVAYVDSLHRQIKTLTDGKIELQRQHEQDLADLRHEKVQADAAHAQELIDKDEVIARLNAQVEMLSSRCQQLEEQDDQQEMAKLGEIIAMLQQDQADDAGEKEIDLTEITAKLDSILRAQQMAARPKEPDDVEFVIMERDGNGFAKRMIARRIKK